MVIDERLIQYRNFLNEGLKEAEERIPLSATEVEFYKSVRNKLYRFFPELGENERVDKSEDDLINREQIPRLW